MPELEERISATLSQAISYWYLDSTQGHAKFTVKEITQLAGPLYSVKIELALWTLFTFNALYMDGESPR